MLQRSDVAWQTDRQTHTQTNPTTLPLAAHACRGLNNLRVNSGICHTICPSHFANLQKLWWHSSLMYSLWEETSLMWLCVMRGDRNPAARQQSSYPLPVPHLSSFKFSCAVSTWIGSSSGLWMEVTYPNVQPIHHTPSTARTTSDYN